MITAQNHQQLGRVLHEARLLLKLEVSQAAAALHIRPRYLRALEEGALENLPGDAYIKGYLSQYSRLLGVDEQSVLEAYRRIGVLPVHRFMYIPESIRKERHPGMILTLATLGLALALTLGWQQMASHAVRHASLVMPPPVPATLKAQMRAPRCLERKQAGWQPCYWRPPAVFSVYPRHVPVKNIMELYEP